jgi:hypothetical protein
MCRTVQLMLVDLPYYSCYFSRYFRVLSGASKRVWNRSRSAQSEMCFATYPRDGCRLRERIDFLSESNNNASHERTF